MPYVEVDSGVRLYYQDLGRGRPVVLLAGWSQCHGVWEQQWLPLSQSHRLIALDLRGTGDSDAPLEGYTYDQHVADVAEAFEKLNLRNVTLVGWSMAGSVALQLAAMHPDRLAQVVVVGSPPKLVNGPDYSDGVDFSGPRSNLDAYWVNRPQTLREVQIASAHITLDEMTIIWLWELAMKAPVWAAGTMYENVITGDVRAYIPKVQTPVQCLYGAYDAFVPVSAGKWIAKTVAHGEYLEFTSSGHMPFLEEAAKFNEALGAFLKKAD